MCMKMFRGKSSWRQNLRNHHRSSDQRRETEMEEGESGIVS